MATTAAQTALILSRLAGVAVAVPSFLVDTMTLNCVLQSYKDRPVQRAIVGGVLLSLVANGFLLWSMIAWFLDPRGPFPNILIIIFSQCKRVHSIVTAYLTFLRTSAMMGARGKTFRPYVVHYIAVFSTATLITVGFHLDAYISTNFNATAARSTTSFLQGYRSFNIVSVLLYSVPALFTDLKFASVGAGANSILEKRFAAIRQYYNAVQWFFFEVILLITTITTLAIGITDSNVVAGNYTEQLLLSLISLNASYSVRAASSTDPTTGSGSASGTGVGGVRTSGHATTRVGPTGSTPMLTTSAAGSRRGSAVAGSMTALVAKDAGSRRSSLTPAVKLTAPADDVKKLPTVKSADSGEAKVGTDTRGTDATGSNNTVVAEESKTRGSPELGTQSQ
ncbi:hypothetical protein GGF31_000272 [Allomyces arbusculus]|nr:hypothetical protein GGF31_000272 [Allomyces arbusculus]